MKRMKKKSLLLVAGIVLMLTIAIGGTIAYLVTNTDSITNTFEPGRVPITVEETYSGATKSNVSIKNTGNVSAYIRAKIIVTWKKGANEISATQPVKGTDYEISINEGAWESNGGYWYCKTPVAAGYNTPVLIISCTKTGTPPDGYDLSVEIIAESIQADGMGVTSAVKAFEKANQ